MDCLEPRSAQLADLLTESLQSSNARAFGLTKPTDLLAVAVYGKSVLHHDSYASIALAYPSFTLMLNQIRVVILSQSSMTTND